MWAAADAVVCITCARVARQADRETLNHELEDTRKTTTALLEAGRLRERKLRMRLAEAEAQVRRVALAGAPPTAALALTRCGAALARVLMLLRSE